MVVVRGERADAFDEKLCVVCVVFEGKRGVCGVSLRRVSIETRLSFHINQSSNRFPGRTFQNDDDDDKNDENDSGERRRRVLFERVNDDDDGDLKQQQQKNAPYLPCTFSLVVLGNKGNHNFCAKRKRFFLKSSLSLFFFFVSRFFHLWRDIFFWTQFFPILFTTSSSYLFVSSTRETTRPTRTTATTTTMLLNPLLPTTTTLTKTTTLMMTRAGRPTTQGRTPKPLKRHHHPCVDVRSAKKEEKAKKQPKGGLTKKRCDACLGAGKVPCYNCTTKLTGWGDGRAVSVADKVGYVPKKTSLFSLPFGWKTTTSSSANNTKKTKKKKTKDDVNDDLVRCPACAETTPGKLVCSRCQGQGSLYYRSAEWK